MYGREADLISLVTSGLSMEENGYHEQLNDYDDENEAAPRHRTKSETLAELRRKEHGQKYEMTKIDYTSHLKKTGKAEAAPREKKTSTDSPNYLQQLRKTDTGVATQPEYIRLAKNAEMEGKHSDKRYTADELINMAFKKASDADGRDSAYRRGIVQQTTATQKPTAVSGTFEGIKPTDDTKEDYKAALKQHVKIEPKAPVKAHYEKPSWANITPKRVVEADIKSKARENKQEKPEWAQFGRGAKKHIAELEHAKTAEKSQAPEWANLVNKTDRKRLIELESKKVSNSDSSQPEWATKSRDPREVLRVETKASKKSASDDSPDYKGVLRRGSKKESTTFGELQRALGDDEDNNGMGWKLIDRLTLLDDSDQSVTNNLNTINEDFFDVNSNEFGKRPNENGHDKQNGSNQEELSERGERRIRRKSSSAQGRRKSSATRFSLAIALPVHVRREVSAILMDWAQEIMNDYENCTINNFTTSWDDGLAFCNIIHYYEDSRIPIHKLKISSKRANLMIAFQVASDIGISLPITVDDLMKTRIPDAHKVFDILYEVYSHYHGPLVEWGVLK